MEKTKQEVLRKQRQENIAGLDQTQRKAAALIHSVGRSYLDRKEGERKSKIEDDFNNGTVAHSIRMEHSVLQIQVFLIFLLLNGCCAAFLSQWTLFSPLVALFSVTTCWILQRFVRGWSVRLFMQKEGIDVRK